MLGRSKRLEPKLFYTGLSLDSRIPADHALRRIRHLVDFDFVRADVAGLYGINGNPSIDPAILLKLMLLLFLENVSSERALMEQMAYRLDWLWFCGYDLDEDVPNHSVLSKARRRWGLDVFTGLFKRVLQQCVDAGLVEGDLLHVDGSLIAANASKDTLRPDLRGLSEALYTTLDQAAGDDADAAPVAEQADDDDRPSKTISSPTDPDARMTRKNGQTVLGYKEHRVVDDAHGIVTATATTDAAVDESHMLETVLNRHRFNTGLLEDRVAADKGYGTREVYKMLPARSVTPCIPHQKHGGGHGPTVSFAWRATRCIASHLAVSDAWTRRFVTTPTRPCAPPARIVQPARRTPMVARSPVIRINITWNGPTVVCLSRSGVACRDGAAWWPKGRSRMRPTTTVTNAPAGEAGFALRFRIC